MSAIGNEMNVFEEMAAEWQRRLWVITAMLLASESESERQNLPLFADSSLLQPQADGAQEWVQREENALLLRLLLIDQSTWKKKKTHTGKKKRKEDTAKRLETFSWNFLLLHCVVNIICPVLVSFLVSQLSFASIFDLRATLMDAFVQTSKE